MNPLDKPFGEPFASYLKRGPQIGARKPQPARSQPQPNTTPIKPGDYQSQLTSTLPGSQVHLITKNHASPWHPVEQILSACRLCHSYGWREFTPIGKYTATIKIHTD